MQEATVVIRNIFRKYPNRYESIISVLCEHLDSLDEPEAKAAMVWVIGQYADRIENSDVLLDDFLFSFHDEPVEVQLALLTATVKLFIQRPTKGETLVPKVLKWATEETDNPDLRDRGFFYWRLLSTDVKAAKQIVMGEKPPVTAESEKLDAFTLEEMCLSVGTLATVYLKPVQQVFRFARPRKLIDSPALQKHMLPSYQAQEAMRKTSLAQRSQQQQANGNGKAAAVSSTNGHASTEAVNQADVYFASLGQRMAGMNVSSSVGNDFDDFGAAPTVRAAGSGGGGEAGERGYVVNQNYPEHMYEPVTGAGEGDLLDL